MIASILTLKKNKKAQMTMFIFFGIILVLGIIFFLLATGIMANKINNALSQDIDLGQVNLKDLNELTYGKYNTMLVNHSDFMGICAIFGMILGLFLSSYALRGKLPKWALILDVFIIFAVFIFSIYLSKAYSVLVNSLAEASEPFLETIMPKTSMFMLNLPIFVVIIGVVMMVLFHSSIPRKREERFGREFQGI